VFVNAGIAENKDQFFGEELDSEGLLKEPDRKTLVIDSTVAHRLEISIAASGFYYVIYL
jgi:hypothetical protein